MITNLSIEDFQSIEKLDVECGSITVFHGESDTGKSAIVRAIYALAFNDYPKGHVRDGQPDSRVTVVLEDGTIVSARKGKGTNRYELDGSEWNRVGTNVPEEVTEALGWKMLEIDDGTKFTPNFHRQFDPPFLITETPSKKAKLLGSLTNIATLYAAMKEGLSRERENKTKTKTWTEIHETAQAEAIEVEDAGGVAEALFVDVSARLFKIQEMSEKTASLVIALDEVEKLKGRVVFSKTLLRDKKAAVIDLEGVAEAMEEWTKLRRRVTAIATTTEAVLVANGRLSRAKAEKLLGEEALVRLIAENPMCPMCGKEWHS